MEHLEGQDDDERQEHSEQELVRTLLHQLIAVREVLLQSDPLLDIARVRQERKAGRERENEVEELHEEEGDDVVGISLKTYPT